MEFYPGFDCVFEPETDTCKELRDHKMSIQGRHMHVRFSIQGILNNRQSSHLTMVNRSGLPMMVKHIFAIFF